MFPFTIRYKRTLDHRFDTIETKSIMEVFEENIFSKSICKVTSKTDLFIAFKIDFFSSMLGGKWDLWAGINHGKIGVEESGEKRKVIYEFNTSLIFITGFAGGLLFGIISHLWWVGCFFFILLGLVNWGLALNRHDDNLTGVLNDILKKQTKIQI